MGRPTCVGWASPMNWSAPNGVSHRTHNGQRQVKTPLFDWFDLDDPNNIWRAAQYIGWVLGIAEAKRQEREIRLQGVLKEEPDAN